MAKFLISTLTLILLVLTIKSEILEEYEDENIIEYNDSRNQVHNQPLYHHIINNTSADSNYIFITKYR